MHQHANYIYVCTTVDDIASAVDRFGFAMYLADIKAWLS